MLRTAVGLVLILFSHCLRQHKLLCNRGSEYPAISWTAVHSCWH